MSTVPAAPPGTGGAVAPPPLGLKAGFFHMVRLGASDLRVKVGRPPAVRLRGDLAPLDPPALRQGDLRGSVERLLPPSRLREFAESHEADVAATVPGAGRFRVGAGQQKGTMAFATWNQREVGRGTGTIAPALLLVLRQDPEVILIGEIRDLETLDAALTAACTGHLVLSTLHATDAAGTISRVLGCYPPHRRREVCLALADALAAVVSLRPIPRADRPGRVPACAILVNTEPVRDRIRGGGAAPAIADLIREGSAAYGMPSFDQSLMQWVVEGGVRHEPALRHATAPAAFALHLQGVDGASHTPWDGCSAGDQPH